MFASIKKFGNRIAIEDENLGTFSYKNLCDLSNKIKKKILQKNICLLVCDNNLESIIGYIAFMNTSNTVTILIDQSFKNNFINKIISTYKPKYILAPKNMSFKNCFLEHKIKSYNLYKSNFKVETHIEYINYLMLPTSGTTQSPKFVRLSKNNLIKNSKNIIETLNIKKNHTTITTMPMGYSYGLSIINTHLLSGSKIILNSKSIFEKEFWKKIINKNISSFGGVPEFYDYLKKIKFEKQNLSTIKYISQAGGKLEASTTRYLAKICKTKRIKMFKMYGQTEASPRISILHYNSFFKKKESVGKPLKGTSIKLLDKEGKIIRKKNTIGQILFHGDNVCLGYANNIADLSKRDVNKKNILTGDLAYRDKDNFYYIVGRIKRIIKIFGIRMDMDDIENFMKKNKIICKCNSLGNKLVLKIENLKLEEKSRDILSEYLGINKNYIIAELNETKSLKKMKLDK